MPSLLIVATLLAVTSAHSSEPDLQTGISQVNDGDLEAGIRTLDAVIAKLRPDGTARAKELAQAHLYKGVAQVGLMQEEPAKASFREALQHDPELRLAKGQFPDRVIRVFEAAREGKTKSVMKRPSGATKKAGLGGLGIAAIVGGVALAGGGVALAAKGNETAPPSPGLSSAVTPITALRGVMSLEYVSAQPPPGTTVAGYASAAAFASTLNVFASVANPTGTDARGCNAWVQMQSAGAQCVRVMTASTFSLAPGQSLQVEIGTPATPPEINCATPVQIKTMHIVTTCSSGPFFSEVPGAPGYTSRDYSINYQINP